MRLKVLGCSGGIGSGMRTTSLLLDDDILIDAGTGVGDLSFDDLMKIDHVFVTHSHLDHTTSIPFLVDTVGFFRDKPITVHALEATIRILRDHMFNWKLWPDFSVIPSAETPVMVFRSFSVGETLTLGGRKITPVPANHVVPAVGFHLDSGAGSLVFSGDTTVNDPLWEVVNRIGNLRYLIIETAFCNREKELAVAAKHLCPSMLAEELKKLKVPAEIYVTHLKPGEVELTMKEIEQDGAAFKPRMLQNNQILEF
ncbi:MAG: 3',5'-cyclic-nucleotide phosphodiesterase [Sulfuricellaceae bacterium]|jgi:ribonuclease BN (tRNA processing enzyme)